MTKLVYFGALLVLIVSTVHGQTISQIPITAVAPLSSEQSISVEDPPLIPAPGSQREVAIASAGGSALAVWADGRYGGYDIFASRLDAEGRPLDPMGIPVAPTYADDVEPDVVWTGSRYFVVWRSFLGVSRATVSDDGVVTGSSFVRIAGPTVVTASAVAWDGERVLVIWVQRGLEAAPDDPLHRVFGVFLEETGESITDPFLLREAEPGSRIIEPEIASDGNGFVAAWEESIGGRRRVVTLGIDSSGVSTPPSMIGDAVDPLDDCISIACKAHPEIEAGEGEYLVAWSDDRLNVRRVDESGRSIGNTVSITEVGAKALMPAALWKDGGWTIWWSQASASDVGFEPVTGELDMSALDLHGIDLSQDLAPRAPSRVVVSRAGSQIAAELTVISDNVVGVWSDLRNAPDSTYAPRCCSVGDLFAVSDDRIGSSDENLVAMGLANQRAPIASTIGDTILVVWCSQIDDDEFTLRLRRFDGFGSPVGDAVRVPGSRGRLPAKPSIGASSERFLIGWIAGGSSGPEGRVTRVENGIVDVAPIRVGPGTEIDVVSDGNNFLVTMSREAPSSGDVDQRPLEIVSTIVPASGDVMPPQKISEASTGLHGPIAAWTGGQYLVVWSRTGSGGLSTSIHGRFLSVAGSPLGAQPILIAEDSKFRPSADSVASNGTAHLVTGGFGSRADGVALGYLLASDGSSASAVPTGPGTSVPGSHSVWDGERFVLSFERMVSLEAGRVVLAFTELIRALPASHDQGWSRAFVQIVPYGGRERPLGGTR